VRGLEGRFVHHDAERLPFENDSFDVVYSNGVIHHTPNTTAVINEVWRVLRPGGRAIIMVYAENSWHYWYQLVFRLGVGNGLLRNWSMGEIMSRYVELSDNGGRPLVKVYTKRRLKNMFSGFEDLRIIQRQMTAGELPWPLTWILPPSLVDKFIGWNLVIKANKPREPRETSPRSD
jgi:ubiquinone/menaquinone biosynthesis C-methylase UbiE